MTIDELISECLRRAKSARVTENYIATIRARDTAEPLSVFLERIAIALRNLESTQGPDSKIGQPGEL